MQHKEHGSEIARQTILVYTNAKIRVKCVYRRNLWQPDIGENGVRDLIQDRASLVGLKMFRSGNFDPAKQHLGV